MYKNFYISEKERKEILEQHMSHGYRQPINEVEINMEDYNDESSIISDIKLVGTDKDGNPLLSIVISGGIVDSGMTKAELSKVTIVLQIRKHYARRKYSKDKTKFLNFIVGELISVDSEMNQESLKKLIKRLFDDYIYYGVDELVKGMYRPYISYLLEKGKYDDMIKDKIQTNISNDVDKINKLLDSLGFPKYIKPEEQPSPDKEVKPEPSADKKSIWTSTNTWNNK